VSKLQWQVSVDARTGIATIKQFEQAQKHAIDQTQRQRTANRDLAASLSSARTAIMGVVAAFGGYVAITRAISLGKDFIEASNKQASAIAGMETAMRSMGRYTSTYSAELQALAGELQGVTNFGDEVTETGIKFMMTFDQITNELMPRSIKAMQDLAAMMGGGESSVVRAANMLGKASMGMTGELRKAGITVDAETYKLKGYAGLLELVERQVKGQAEAQRKATAGYDALGNEIGDVKETLGDIIKFRMEGTFEAWNSSLRGLNDTLKKSLEHLKKMKEWGSYQVQMIGEIPVVQWKEGTRGVPVHEQMRLGVGEAVPEPLTPEQLAAGRETARAARPPEPPPPTYGSGPGFPMGYGLAYEAEIGESKDFETTVAETNERYQANLEALAEYHAQRGEIIHDALYAEMELTQEQMAAQTAYENQMYQMRLQTAQNWLSTTQALMQAAAAFGLQDSKVLFYGMKAIETAKAVISAFSAANLALATPPGPPATIPLSQATLAMGLANAAAIAATAIGQGSGRGGAKTVPTGGLGVTPTLTPGGPAVPVASTFGQPGAGAAGPVNVYLYGDFLNDEDALIKWADKMSELVRDRAIVFHASHATEAEGIA